MTTILLIDDDPTILANMSQMLEFEGYSVLTAHNGVEGVALAEQHDPDVIFSDIHMPGMQGQEVQQILRESSITASTPFIFMTAAPDELLRDARRIVKPFKLDQMLEVIREVLL